MAPDRGVVAAALQAAIGIVLCSAVVLAHASQSSVAPRAGVDQPNIEGFWGPGGQSVHENVEDGSDPLHNAVTGEDLRPANVIIDPPDGKIPYQPWADALQSEIYKHRADPKPEHLDPSARCFAMGVPRMHYYFSGFRILQASGHVVFLAEAMHAYRIVPLDGRPHVGERIKLWSGDSRGRWEGDTLVIDVRNNHEAPWFDWAGNFHSDAFQVVERWRLVDANTLNYRATFTDPKTYTRPWTMSMNLVRNTQENYELMEDACHEGNRSIELSLER